MVRPVWKMHNVQDAQWHQNCRQYGKIETHNKKQQTYYCDWSCLQFAISIRLVQLTVHHDPEFKKEFVHSVCYEEFCEACNFQRKEAHVKYPD